MKLLPYTLAALGGACIAGLITYRSWRLTAAHGEPAAFAAVKAVVPSPAPASSAELERLARENADLTAQLADARARLAERDATLNQTKERLDELRRPMTADMLSSTLRAELKSGEVVVTGGYRLPDGRRLYAFARPVVESVDGADVVKVGVQVFKVGDELGSSLGLDSIATNAANTIQHGEVWVTDEYASVALRLQSTPGVEGVSFSPDVAVKPGGSTTVEAGDLRLRLTPLPGADHETMDLEVRVEQPQVSAPATPPVSPQVQPPK